MKRSIFTILLFSFFGFNSFACSCFGPETFCGFVFDNFESPDLIVKGTKIGDVEHGMDISISLIIDGNETNQTIRVWGDVGHLCRMYTSNFNVRDEYLFALDRIETPSQFPGSWTNLEIVGDYVISVCGKSFWSCSDESNGGETAADIEKCFGKPLGLCGKSSTNEKEICDALKTDIYPNPASTTCNINLAANTNLYSGNARIFDACGKEVARFDNLNEFYSQNRLSFDLNQLQSGFYFLDLNLPDICVANVTRQIMVNR